MAFAFLIAGALFIIAGVRGTDDELLKLLKNDLSGNPSFIPWISVILLIGAAGYIESVRPVSRAFLVLAITVLLLSNGGFFQKFFAGIRPMPEQQKEIQ
jgi:hypothetical protein